MNKPEGTDNFEEKILGQFHGYVSSADPTSLKPNILVRGSVNVYKKLSGTIANRPGRKQYDAVDSTLAGVKSDHTWYTSLGATLPVRVANSKFSVYSTITGTGIWYDLQTSVTLTRYVFDTIWDNTLKKDFLVFVRGSSDLFRWEGGMALISSTTSNTVVLDRTVASSGMSTTSGSVLINGTTYTYSGSSGSTLTGVSGDPTGEANGSVVISAVITTGTSPASGFTGDFLKTINNQLYVGSYTSRLVYISKNSSYIDYTQSTPRVPGDGDVLTLDNACKGITVKDGEAWISAGTSDWYKQTFKQITVGTTLTEQTVVDKQPTPALAAAYAHEFITVINDTIVYLSQDQQLRTIGLYRDLNQPAYPSLSQEISTELSEEDFTLGHIKAIKDFIYLVAPNAGRVYLHQTRLSVNVLGNVVAERLWHAPFIWGVSRINEINGTVVGYSNSNPQLYSLWDTGQWHDDAPDTDTVLSLPYSSVMLLAYQNGGRRQGKINFNKMYYEGYAVGNLYEATYYDYQGATNVLSSILNSAESPFPKTYTGLIPPSLGDASLGDNPLGSGLNTASDDQDLLPKFRTIVGKSSVDCFEFAPMVYSNEVDSRWEILALGANVTLSPSAAVEIIKKR